MVTQMAVTKVIKVIFTLINDLEESLLRLEVFNLKS